MHYDSIKLTLQKIEKWWLYGSKKCTYKNDVPTKSTVLLIGAGITNLISAVYLVENNYNVTLVDQCPLPSTKKWISYGCTHGGGNARMFSFTEMDNYTCSYSFPNKNPLYDNNISSMGWLIKDNYTDEEKNWINSHNSVPPWLAEQYKNDIYELTSICEEKWKDFVKKHISLFVDTDYTDSILRIYNSKERLEYDINRHKKLNALLSIFNVNDLETRYPYFNFHKKRDDIVGGLLVKGFTVNVEKLSHNIIKWLGQKIEIKWNYSIKNINRDENGKVLSTNDGKKSIYYDSYVISPGAYGEKLLDGTPCKGKIHGMIGAWLEFSNYKIPIKNSIKISRKGYISEDYNVTVSVDSEDNNILILGYGHIGQSSYKDVNTQIKLSLNAYTPL